MAEITATLVKALREATGQGMMECKKALGETGGDIDAAKDLLRKKGLLTAQKKAARTTSEGLIGLSANSERTEAAMVEVRCETDFCARNQVFRDMVSAVTKMASVAPAGQVEPTDAIRDAVQAALSKIGENMGYARGIKIAAPRVGTYLHHNQKVGVIIGVNGNIDDETLTGLCMHIAFADPMAVSPKDIDPAVIEKEREIALAQAVRQGKNEQVAEKMVIGKINKFLADNALLEQVYVRDETKKVKDLLGGAAVTAFARFAVGSAG